MIDNSLLKEKLSLEEQNAIKGGLWIQTPTGEWIWLEDDLIG